MRHLYLILLCAFLPTCGDETVRGPSDPDTYIPCQSDEQCQDDGRFPNAVCREGRCYEPRDLPPMGE